MDNLIDQLQVIRVQLDELEKEIRGMMPEKEEKPPVTWRMCAGLWRRNGIWGKGMK